MPDLFLGLDIGTSGARAVVIDSDGDQLSESRSAMSEHGVNLRSPDVWWAAAHKALHGALAQVDVGAVRGLAVDGTSGTILRLDKDGAPVGDGLMYNDACADPDILAAIADAAPKSSPTCGANSALARAIQLAAIGEGPVVHQADWIAARLSGCVVSDENNALKTGFDLAERCWPEWIAATGFDSTRLPPVLEPGTAVGRLSEEATQEFGLSLESVVVAGTTDGCASFVATGADQPGDGVTALGTTLTIKLLSNKEISAPEFGIYSHRILGHWLAGGASNTGGAALLEFFDAETLAKLSAHMDIENESPFDYYPLVRPGERFPIADPDLPPRLDPRPEDDVAFLKGLLDGIARVEALAYDRLAELGAPPLRTVRSVGGGAINAAWTGLRKRRLGVPMPHAASTEAAYGSALLAKRGASACFR